jgi:hypothetical protein
MKTTNKIGIQRKKVISIVHLMAEILLARDADCINTFPRYNIFLWKWQVDSFAPIICRRIIWYWCTVNSLSNCFPSFIVHWIFNFVNQSTHENHKQNWYPTKKSDFTVSEHFVWKQIERESPNQSNDKLILLPRLFADVLYGIDAPLTVILSFSVCTYKNWLIDWCLTFFLTITQILCLNDPSKTFYTMVLLTGGYTAMI